MTVFLILLLLTSSATVLGLAPVSLHRVLFRHGLKDRLVKTASRLLSIVLACVALAITGSVLLIFDVVTTRSMALTVAGGLLVGIVLLWLLVPRREMRYLNRMRPGP